MGKIKEIFKKVRNIVYDLFIFSNRGKHLIAGGLIYLAVIASMAVWNPFEPMTWPCAVGSTMAAFIAMCAVEYKDKAHGGVFDWKDIFAGVVLPIVGDIVIIGMMLFG